MENQPTTATIGTISIRQLQQGDLAEADRIFRLAFGTFLGLPDPTRFFGDADYVRTRWLADPEAALAAEVGGALVGSNFATNWGSVGFFGPLTVRPDVWERGIAKSLLESTMQLFTKWGTTHTGLFTFAQSAKHVALYQKFGFWPRFLTAVMDKRVEPRAARTAWSGYSMLAETEQANCLDHCRELTDAIYPGLNVEREIRAVDEQRLGETVLLWDEATLVAVGACHCGAGTEAGGEVCYVKFGAARPGARAAQHFERLLDACEAWAVRRHASRLVAGVNMARHEAYRHLIDRGFRTTMQGVAMHKPDEPGYNRPGIYLIDDWR